MIIDTHAHLFPDELAPKVVSELVHRPKDVRNYTDGTKKGLLASMKKAGIDYTLVLPICAKPTQFDSINRFAAELNGKDGILSFGSVHPDCENVKEKLLYIRSLGLKGIKLHPTYQGTYIDDPRYVDIIRTAIELDLLVVIHAGVDAGIPTPVYCPPVRIAHMLDLVYAKQHPTKAHIILAHVGGLDMYDEVERCLVGRNIYFDLSFSLGKIGTVQLLRIIQDHGADRILFASDSPFVDQSDYLKVFDALPLFDDERELILFKNAAGLLGIEV